MNQPKIQASDIQINLQENAKWLRPFAAMHQIEKLDKLLDLPLSSIQRMEGFSIQVQNDIIDLLERYDLTDSLKEY